MTLKEKIWERYSQSGLTDQQIAEKVGCSKSYVRLTTAGGMKKNLTEKDKVRIGFLWGEGVKSTAQIGTEIGIGPLRVERFLRINGLL